MAKAPAPPAPPSLDAAGTELWEALASMLKHPATPADCARLRRIVDVTARLEQVREHLSADGLTVAGSTGQQRAHPLLTVEARLRAELAEEHLAWANLAR